MAIKVVLVGALVALAAASLRPSTPDQLHQMLLWAQRAQEREAPLGALRLHDKQGAHGKAELKHRQPPTPPPAPLPAWTPPPPPPPPPFADDAELARPRLPSHEEYDRSLRFSHSILHGFRDAQ